MQVIKKAHTKRVSIYVSETVLNLYFSCTLFQIGQLRGALILVVKLRKIEYVKTVWFKFLKHKYLQIHVKSLIWRSKWVFIHQRAI